MLKKILSVTICIFAISISLFVGFMFLNIIHRRDAEMFLE